ncbi:MAG: tol-pal system protein YbgF [Pikeienuella sp.]
MRPMMRRAPAGALSGLILSALAALSIAGGAAAQGVDRYEFLETKRKVETLEKDVSQLRGALGSGGVDARVNQIEDELRSLIGQVERLEHSLRQQEAASKQKLMDLEYRIIELEGGDPSILFQEENQDDQGALTPPPATQQQGGSLGVLTSTAAVAGDEQAAFDAAAAAARSGRTADARRLLEGFLSDYPGSPLAGDAHYWLGESLYQDGQLQAAAQRFLDGATLNSGSAMAPESMLKLGVTLGVLGKKDVACSTLREVRGRYPQASAVISRASTEADRLGCG